MMKIRILAIGRKANGWAAEAEKDFLERLSRCADTTCELTPPLDEHRLGGQACREQESEKLLAKCRPDELVIACDRGGTNLSSQEFSKELGKAQSQGARVCLIIGGSHGLSEHLLKKARLVISFSRLTFPHELFRIMLLEQLYRAFTIITGKKYHK